jgi:hypothetical protein
MGKGRLELKTYQYPVESTVKKVTTMPVPEDIRRDLIHVLRTGTAPKASD